MKRDPLRPILDVAVAHAVSYTRLSTEEVVASRRRWRETFAQGVFAATGEWRHLGFDWHAFSYEHLPAEIRTALPLKQVWIIQDA